MAHDRMLATAGSYSWIHKYIFPGGIIPSLRVIESRRLGLSYARTLDRWRHTFAERTDEVLGLGFDETLHADVGLLPRVLPGGLCQAYLDVWQLGLGRE